MTLSFSAPEIPVKIGIPFSWQVLVVNNSSKTAKLAILPVPRMQRPTSQAQNHARRHAPKASNASFQASERQHGRKSEDVDIAQAIVDENVVYAMQHSGAVPPETDLVALTAELRVGPLAPGQCHECDIKFVAFKTGTFTVDAIRVVDLIKEVEEGIGAQGVIMDVRDLPDIVVVD